MPTSARQTKCTERYITLEANRKLLSYCLSSNNLKMIEDWHDKAKDPKITAKLLYGELSQLMGKDAKNSPLVFSMILECANFQQVLNFLLQVLKK